MNYAVRTCPTVHFSWTATYLRTCAASDQNLSDQNLHWVHFGSPRMQSFFMRTTKTLARLCGRTSWYESSLGTLVKKYSFSCWGQITFDSDFQRVQRTDSWTRKIIWDMQEISSAYNRLTEKLDNVKGITNLHIGHDICACFLHTSR